jgi:hypothetical protein
VVGKLATGDHHALHARALDADDAKFNLPVAEDQFVAGHDIYCEIRVGHADGPVGAVPRADRRVEREGLALREQRGTRGKSLDTDLGALQVPEHGHVLAHGRRRAAHGLDPLAVVIRRSVREIHAHDVRTAADDFLEHARRIGCRAQRGDNLGSTEHCLPLAAFGCR